MIPITNKRWIRALVLILITAIALGLLMLQPPVAQDPDFHVFADNRSLFGILNFWNVASNIFFIVVGIWGLAILPARDIDQRLKWMYGCLFTGIILTAFGSAYYHYAPDNHTLVYDRIPMTIIFMSFLSVTIGEYISARAGIVLLVPLLLTGAGSVLWWHYTESNGQGDLRLYFFMQFFPMILVPLIYLLYPRKDGKRNWALFGSLIFFYLLAKIGEHYDREIFTATGFSGHSMKHILAAVTTACFVWMMPAGKKKLDISTLL